MLRTQNPIVLEAGPEQILLVITQILVRIVQVLGVVISLLGLLHQVFDHALPVLLEANLLIHFFIHGLNYVYQGIHLLHRIVHRELFAPDR